MTLELPTAEELMRLDALDLEALAWRLEWNAKRGKHQIPPDGDWWTIWLLLAGRGAGKTRTAAETLGQWAWDMPGTRWLVSAPTYSDLTGVCFEGESGLLNVIPHALIEPSNSGSLWNRSDVELRLKNGSMIKGISAEKPERFRGPQFHGGWLDEFAAWQYAQEAFDMLMFGMRLGDRPRIIATTTPKPKGIIRSLVKRDGKDVALTRASTYDNMANLAPTFREQILQYEGTPLGRQEIEAELLDPEEAGIVKRSQFKLWPADKKLPEFEYMVLSLDTAFTEANYDGKTGKRDPTACTVWGLFRHEGKDGILLLDAWQDHLGFPDLIERVRKEMQNAYGEREKPIISPAYGKPMLHGAEGHKPDLCIIEEKGSGISLKQMLAREGVYAYGYNPGKARKVDRLHAVSHLFAHGLIWLPESAKNPGQARNWCDDMVAQLCTFVGEGSTEHDDYVDSTTQALRLLADRKMISVHIPNDGPKYVSKPPDRSNPYAQ